MEIEGYIVVSDHKGEKKFLSGNRWIKDVMKLRLSDITPSIRNVYDIKNKKNDTLYYNAQITISIQI